MRAARFPRNLARNDANRFREDRAAIRKRRVRNESCGARRQSARLQLAIDGGELRRIVCAVPPRGVDPGSVVECIDFDPGVVGNRGQARMLRVVQRLQSRVCGERAAGLLRLRDPRELRQRPQLERDAVENLQDFTLLAAIGCRDQDRSAHCAATAEADEG